MKTDWIKKTMVAFAVFWMWTGSITAALVTDGMVLHAHAESVATWSLNGKVARMNDLSGSGNDNDIASQSVNDGPTIQADALNGYDTLYIGGTTEGLRILAADASDFNVTTNGLTLFAVFSTPYNSGYVVRKGNDNSSSEVGYSIFTDSTSGGRIHSRAADDSGTRQGTTLTTSSTDFVVYGMIIDPSAGTLTSLYNGTVMSSWFSDGAIDDTITSADDFGIGNNANAAGMELAEIVVYNRSLETAEWNEVGATLGDKYAIDNTYVIPEPATLGLLAFVGAALMTVRRLFCI